MVWVDVPRREFRMMWRERRRACESRRSSSGLTMSTRSGWRIKYDLRDGATIDMHFLVRLARRPRG